MTLKDTGEIKRLTTKCIISDSLYCTLLILYRYLQLTRAGKIPIPSSDIKVGQFIVVDTNQRVPAGTLILRLYFFTYV